MRVVTDGGADVTPELGARLKIETIRGPVCFGGNHWRGEPGEFWSALRRGENLPATEAPSVADLAASYVVDGPVMAVHVSSELSRTVAHARAAAAEVNVEVEVEVEVVDSRSLSVGTGLVAMAAAQAIEAGAEWERLREMVAGWVDEVHLHGLIDDVGFLVRGGRAGLVAARLSKHAHRHVVAVKGHVIPVRQVRHRGEAIREMVAHIREHVPDGASRWAVGHGDAYDVDAVVERLVAVFGCDPAFVTLLGPPVGSHMGPGAIAVAFFSRS
ncbi:MAG TPA: DegV family protein [Acidimicrobiales bacterium]|nr:DegV family protein [Acidimicrobiales bacterium]